MRANSSCVPPYTKRCLRSMVFRYFATACTCTACVTQSLHLQGIQRVLTDCMVAHSSWLEADGTLCDNFALVSTCKAKGLQLAAVIALSKVLIKPDDWEYFGHHAAAQSIRQFIDSTHKRIEQWMASDINLAMPIPCLRPYTQIICKLLQSCTRCCLPTVCSCDLF